jgi:hypothetical protein
MAKIIDFGIHLSPRDDPPRTPNQEILDRIKAMAEAADTREARLLSELRGMEETLLANHRKYARLWEAAEQLGIVPPVRTAERIVADADPMFPEGTPPLPTCLSVMTGSPEERTPADLVERARTPSPHPTNGHTPGHKL